MMQSSVTYYTDVKSPTASIAKLPIASRHNVDITQSFKGIRHNKNPKLLVISVTVLINMNQRPLCSQKLLALSFSILWH